MAFQIGAYKMTIKLINKGGSGGSLPRLAPDLTFPSTPLGPTTTTRSVTINPVGALTTALSLTGKFYIGALSFAGLTAETITIKLTVDGVVIWNDTFSSGLGVSLLGEGSTTNAYSDVMQCNSSFLLEIQTLTDTIVTLNYLARPIL